MSVTVPVAVPFKRTLAPINGSPSIEVTVPVIVRCASIVPTANRTSVNTSESFFILIDLVNKTNY